jgi:urease beta subunit
LEGNTSTTAITFTVTLSAPYDAPVVVPFATAEYWYGSQATAGVDYAAASGTVTFAPGDTSETITVLVTGDRFGEYDEFFWVNLGPSTSAHISSGPAVGAIVNDEPFVSIYNASLVEGHAGSKTLDVTVTLSAPYDSPVTVEFATADGSATAASGDYQATSGSVTFAIGQTTQTISIPVKGDRLAESDEYFSVNLATGYLLTAYPATGYGTILDDEPRISISSASIVEGNSGTRLLTFTVSLSAAYDQTVTVNYATRNGNAQGGSDYVATSGTLTFSPGQTTKTFTVAIRGDKKKEVNESFYVVLSGASSNALIAYEYAYGTILNDD